MVVVWVVVTADDAAVVRVPGQWVDGRKRWGEGGGSRDGNSQMEMQIRKQACWLHVNVATAASVAMILLLFA